MEEKIREKIAEVEKKAEEQKNIMEADSKVIGAVFEYYRFCSQLEILYELVGEKYEYPSF